MRINGYFLARCEPGDERCGQWSREELEAQNARFAAALEQAFELGLESRTSAANQVKVKMNGGPRFVAPLCPATQDGLFRSAENALVVVTRR